MFNGDFGVAYCQMKQLESAFDKISRKYTKRELELKSNDMPIHNDSKLLELKNELDSLQCEAKSIIDCLSNDVVKIRQVGKKVLSGNSVFS